MPLHTSWAAIVVAAGAAEAGAIGQEATPTPAEGVAGLLDLPDHLLGPLYLELDSPSRKALYSSCKGVRESPFINDHIAQKLVKVEAKDAERILTQLGGFPRHALRRLEMQWFWSCFGMTGITLAVQERLRGVHELQVRLGSGLGPALCFCWRG